MFRETPSIENRGIETELVCQFHFWAGCPPNSAAFTTTATCGISQLSWLYAGYKLAISWLVHAVQYTVHAVADKQVGKEGVSSFFS